ncbi:hypothetical protein APHAL10511_007823 [Amanita phalloides]|nr:hypothetical protein APHAL10511_007823 [Amanita phalloides]
MQRSKGVIFTGQPGIGKTLFIWFLLAHLLKMKQAVLFIIQDECLLFYHDEVYTPIGTPKTLIPSPPQPYWFGVTWHDTWFNIIWFNV